MHRVARVKDARTAARIGVDAVTIVGFEAAGHPGMDDVGSLIRIPITVGAIEIPVIAAGGIADGRGLVAALSLGADGVLMGTRFLTSQECRLHPRIKQWLLQAEETDTLLIGRGTTRAARVMRTELALRILEMEKRDMFPFVRCMLYVRDKFRQNNVVWGVGRGSSCACLIFYLLDINRVDPVKYDIPMEEFFKPEKITN